MLPPREFGHYLSTGTKKRNRGQVIYFETELAKIEKLIDMESLNRRFIPKLMEALKALFTFQITRFSKWCPLKH